MHKIVLDKIPAVLEGNDVRYILPTIPMDISLNEWIGKGIQIKFDQQLHCLDCKKIVKKFYAPGLCYVCMMSSPMNSECILRPELCEAHLGRGKVPEWEQKHHNQAHIVYLANSGGLKVGVTRADQIPTRWIDQGADEAIILAKTPYRQLAGEIEVYLKSFLSDKTNWRTMLKNEVDVSINLLDQKLNYSEKIDGGYGEFISEDDTIYKLHYPTTVLRNSINSLKLDKHPQISGTLTGIKGQYFILDEKNVFNVRSHGGYEVAISFTQ